MTDTDTAALLPCPFCGGEARPDAQTHMGRNYVGIICLGCGLWQDTRSPDIIGAIAAWNRRTPPTPATDECTCFGDSGMQASTFYRSDDVRCCDLCGKPVASTPPTPATDTQEESMKLGGGTANGMRALGYQVLPPEPNSDSTCWRMITPQGPHTEHLAADEAEGWCKAEQHWQASSVYNALRRTPAPVSGDLREVVARAIAPLVYATVTGNDDCREWEEMPEYVQDIYFQAADAALTALAPYRAAEIAAAHERGAAEERARVVAWLLAVEMGPNFEASNAQRFADAIQQGEHDELFEQRR